MKKIPIHFPPNQKKCVISIENGIFDQIPDLLIQNPYGEKYAIIADRTVAKLYGEKLVRALAQKKIQSHLFTFQAGERSKNFQTVEKLINQLTQKKFCREDAIIGLGGGVTGDLAGFTASIFMRGLTFLNIPTTLLAMVDASIGGKNGINLTSGKNQVGTFYQPTEIWIDPNFVKSLPDSEKKNGFAEIIKYGITTSPHLFFQLEKLTDHQKNTPGATMNTIIEQCVKIKASIIEEDEFENEKRILLNYGHTMGHAIEQLSDYKIPHGKAISLGIQFINHIACAIGLLEEKENMRINKLLRSFKLIPGSTQNIVKKWTPEVIWSMMQNDKKMQKSKINFIIINKIGNPIIYNKINKSVFLKYFPKTRV